MVQEFDDEVLRALEKWPNVPACYGWLRLSRRGSWLIKDEPISHRRAIAYLQRNYATDESGRWFVQNGPQRAYCDLDYTPWIYQLDGSGVLHTHAGDPVCQLRQLVTDESGDVLLETEYGIGLLHDGDLGQFIDIVDQQQPAEVGDDGVGGLLVCLDPATESRVEIVWNGAPLSVSAMLAEDVPQMFGFTAKPNATTDESPHGTR